MPSPVLGQTSTGLTEAELKAMLGQAVQIATEYLLGNQVAGQRIQHRTPPPELQKVFDVELGEGLIDLSDLFGPIRDYLSLSVRTGHPQFFNQLWGGFSLPGFLGDFFNALARTSMYTYEMAPLATLMELEIMRKMAGFAGWPTGEGTFATGGSNANMLAMLAARNRHLPGSKQTGTQQLAKPLVFFVSDQAHFSFERAAHILGLGMNAMRLVATNQAGQMLPDALAEGILEAVSQGFQPFFVCATAATTVLGAYDPIAAIAPICQLHRTWLHVDGSWGGSALLSPKHRHLLGGIELADSLAWNPHKQMSVSLPCSVLLVRQQGTLFETCSAKSADYLFHQHEYSAYDLGEASLQCGRVVDSLKLWLAWRFFGDAGYASRVDRLFELAELAANAIAKHPNLELMAPVQSTNVCFRWRRPDNPNAFNTQLRDELNRQGKTMINTATLKGGAMCFRWVFANPEIADAELDAAIRNIEEAADAILA